MLGKQVGVFPFKPRSLFLGIDIAVFNLLLVECQIRTQTADTESVKALHFIFCNIIQGSKRLLLARRGNESEMHVKLINSTTIGIHKLLRQIIREEGKCENKGNCQFKKENISLGNCSVKEK